MLSLDITKLIYDVFVYFVKPVETDDEYQLNYVVTHRQCQL